jgi:hypothetical protein
VVQFLFGSADSTLDIQESVWKDALQDATPNVPAVSDVSFVGVQASAGLSGLYETLLTPSLIKLPLAGDDVAHYGLLMVKEVEHLFKAWDVRMEALVCQSYFLSHSRPNRFVRFMV